MDDGILVVAGRELRPRFKFIVDPLNEAGVIFDLLKDEGVGFTFRSLWAMRKRYQTVIVFGGDLKSLLWYFLAALTGAKYVLRVGGDPLRVRKSVLESLCKQRKYLMYLKLYLGLRSTVFLLKKADNVIVVNTHLKKNIEKFNSSISVVSQYRELPNIEGPEFASPVIRFLTVTNLKYIGKSEPLLKMVGGLVTFCFQNSDKSFSLDILGDGVHRLELQGDISKVGLPANLKINFRGYVDNVEDYMRGADVFLYASEVDAVPNVILEAKSFALPVIVNRYEPLIELFNNQESQFFYNLGQKGELVQHLQRLLDPELRSKVGGINRLVIKESYSVGAIGIKLKAALEEVKDV